MTFKPGQSGNPAGRPKMDARVRAMMKENGEKAIELMHELLHQKENFNRYDKNGKHIPGAATFKEQIALIALAQDRAFGRAESVNISHTHSGTVGLNVSNRLKDISERLPERIAQAKIIEAQVEEAELLK